MEEETREIINKNLDNSKIRKYSDQYFFDDHRYYRGVKTNDDVRRAYSHVITLIEHFEKAAFDLVRDDIESLEKELGKYEIAIQKLLQCFDNPFCNFNYTADELNQLIISLDTFEERISNIHIKKVCEA